MFVKVNLHLDGATSVRQVPWVPTPFEYRLRSFTARISEEEKIITRVTKILRSEVQPLVDFFSIIQQVLHNFEMHRSH